MKALKILRACRERGQKRAGGLDIDEAIAELEALQSRSCEGCKSFKNPESKWECALGFRCRRAFRDRYEPKEV